MPSVAVQTNVYLLGAPGAGKGTQAQKLALALGIPQVSTGDMLREIRKENSPLALRVAAIMDSGALVPDEIVIELVRQRLSRPDCRAGVILDGFPRTEAQARALDVLFAAEGRAALRVLLIDVPDEELLARLTGRLVCSECGRSYHVSFYPPAVEGQCDGCGGKLVVRSDDQPAVIAARLRAYHEQTAPLVAYYKDKQVLLTVDGRGDVESVSAALRAALGDGQS